MSRTFQYLIYNRQGDALTLTHKRYRTSLPDAQREYKTVEKLQQDGAVLLGEGRVSKRKIKLTFDYATKDEAEFLSLLNDIGSFFRAKDAPFYLHNLTTDKRTKVYGDFSPEHQDGNEFRIGKGLTINLSMLDAVWEDITESSYTAEFNDGDTYTLDIPSNCTDVFPIIEVTAKSGSPVQFAVESGTGSFETFRTQLINEPTFSSGSKITLDSVDGRLYINDQLNQTMWSAGYFIKFDRYNKKFRYTGSGPVDIKIRWRVRSLY